jgi:hypothetical protein
MATKDRPLRLSGNAQLISEGVKALEALTDENLVAVFPDYGAEEIGISEIELWENMPIRCNVLADMMPVWITWTGTRWIKE